MASRSFQTFLQESLHTVCSKNGNFQKTNRSTSHNRNPSMLLRHVPTIHKKISRGLQQGVTHIDPPYCTIRDVIIFRTPKLEVHFLNDWPTKDA